MGKLSEESFSAIKGELIDGRLTMSGMRSYLIGLFFMSSLFVGVSLAVANANTVGWDTLSSGWHWIYYAEGVLFGIHLLLILLCWKNSAFNQKLLSFGIVLFTYKAAVDPYITVLMFSKDRGMYDDYLPFIIVTLIGGVMLHIIVMVKWLNSLKVKIKRQENQLRKIKQSISCCYQLFLC